ncbi:MAG TPA: hypothetical protein PKC40_01515 [Saprospiraceae bacterium]|nr:hypothetical protein [Saprospiraceae bacterium]
MLKIGWSPGRLWMFFLLFNLLIAAVMGALLRLAYLYEFSWLDFVNFRHGHSHVALLGWVFLSLFSFSIYYFLPSDRAVHPRYNQLFIGLQFCVLGMLVSFPIQGYGAVSITFSTLHTILTYFFVYRFWNDLKKNDTTLLSVQLIRWSLAFLLISTSALWVLAATMAFGMKNSETYYLSVQFFLHFQFNGWFTFAILSFFFRQLEMEELIFDAGSKKIFLSFLISSCFLTYALAVAWANPKPIIFWLNSIGVSLQFVALVYFYKLLFPRRRSIQKTFSGWFQSLFVIALLSFTLKIAIQTFLLIPYVATIAYTIRNFVIGFLHLILLGSVSAFLIGLFLKKKWLPYTTKLTRWGVGAFIFGFLSTEIILFSQGILLWAALGFLPQYDLILCALSLFLPAGIALIFVDFLFALRKRSP